MKNDKYLWSKISEIYSRLSDEKSKKIFIKRLEYSLDNSNAEPLAEMIADEVDEPYRTVLTLIQRRNEYKDRPVILFGAGRWGGFYYNLVTNYKIGKMLAFCDNNKALQGTMKAGLPIWSVEEAVKQENAIFVITSTLYRNSMKKQLLECGIDEERIFLYTYTTKVFGIQYFDETIFRHKEGAFIDGGCLNLMDTVKYMEFDPMWEKVYAFEPDRGNWEKCCEKAKEIPGIQDRVTVVNKGLWSEETELSFASNLGSSTISENGSETIQTIDLDTFMKDKGKVGFLKMDIEGAEMEALIGAKETIKRDKPNLAICLYHKNEDILEIPAYILELNSNYKFYIRHYSCYNWETVLYAVDDSRT